MPRPPEPTNIHRGENLGSFRAPRRIDQKTNTFQRKECIRGIDLIYCLLLVGILSEAMQWDGGKRDERFYWPKTFLPTAAGGKSKIFGQSVQTFPSLPLKVAFD